MHEAKITETDEQWNKLYSHNKKIEKIIIYRQEIDEFLGRAPESYEEGEYVAVKLGKCKKIHNFSVNHNLAQRIIYALSNPEVVPVIRGFYSYRPNQTQSTVVFQRHELYILLDNLKWLERYNNHRFIRFLKNHTANQVTLNTLDKLLAKPEHLIHKKNELAEIYNYLYFMLVLTGEIEKYCSNNFLKVVKRINNDLIHQAQKFHLLFGTINEISQYFIQYGISDSSHAIEQLFSFNLPGSGNYDVSRWKELVFQNKKILKFIHIAPDIEHLNYSQSPANYREALSFARQIKYSNFSPLIEAISLQKIQLPLAVYKKDIIRFTDLCVELGIDKAVYTNMGIPALLKAKTKEYLPHLLVDLGEYYAVNLPIADVRALLLGELTNCCQSIGNQGERCAVAIMTDEHQGSYVVIKKEKNWTKENAYKAEGKIVAQFYAWLDISNPKKIVLDSWERLSEDLDSLFMPLIAEATQQFAQQGIRHFTIGCGGNTPSNELLASFLCENKVSVENPYTIVPSDDKYSDADEEQYVALYQGADGQAEIFFDARIYRLACLYSQNDLLAFKNDIKTNPVSAVYQKSMIQYLFSEEVIFFLLEISEYPEFFLHCDEIYLNLNLFHLLLEKLEQFTVQDPLIPCLRKKEGSNLETCYKKMYTNAVLFNNRDLIDSLIVKHPEFLNDEIRTIICKEAANNNNKELFDAFCVADVDFFSRALFVAASNHNRALIRQLVAEYNVSQVPLAEKGKLLVSLSALDHGLALIKEMPLHDVGSKYVKKAYVYALGHGHFETAIYLIPYIKDLFIISEATIEGIHSYYDYLNKILVQCPNLLLQIKYHPLIKLFAALKVNQNTNPDFKKHLVFLAIYCGQLDLIKSLTKECDVALDVILANNALKLYGMFLTNYIKSHNNEDNFAVIKKYRELSSFLKKILNQSYLSNHVDNALLLLFCSSEHVENLQYFLENSFLNKTPFYFSASDKLTAVLVALSNKREEVANFLIDQFWDVMGFHYQSRIIRMAIEQNTSIRHLFVTYQNSLVKLDDSMNHLEGDMLFMNVLAFRKKGRDCNEPTKQINEHLEGTRSLKKKCINWQELFYLAQFTLSEENLNILEEFLDQMGESELRQTYGF